MMMMMIIHDDDEEEEMKFLPNSTILPITRIGLSTDVQISLYHKAASGDQNIFAWPYHVSIFCSEEFSLKCLFYLPSRSISASERSQLLSHGMPGWLMNPIEVAHFEEKIPC